MFEKYAEIIIKYYTKQSLLDSVKYSTIKWFFYNSTTFIIFIYIKHNIEHVERVHHSGAATEAA